MKHLFNIGELYKISPNKIITNRDNFWFTLSKFINENSTLYREIIYVLNNEILLCSGFIQFPNYLKEQYDIIYLPTFLHKNKIISPYDIDLFYNTETYFKKVS